MAEAEGSRKLKKAVATLTDPVIPDKLYFRIGEVATLLGVAAYVLRFWEGEFPQLHPNKGGTGQRLYRRRDVDMALRIKQLLYNEGYTIPGARQLLKAEIRTRQPALPLPLVTATPNPQKLRSMHTELKEIASLLARPLPGSRRLTHVRAEHAVAVGARAAEYNGLRLAPSRKVSDRPADDLEELMLPLREPRQD